MKGKIVGIKGSTGAIRAENGKRYPFHINDLSNAEEKTLNELMGCIVNFEVAPDSRGENKAVDIHITKIQPARAALSVWDYRIVGVVGITIIVFIVSTLYILTSGKTTQEVDAVVQGLKKGYDAGVKKVEKDFGINKPLIQQEEPLTQQEKDVADAVFNDIAALIYLVPQTLRSQNLDPSLDKPNNFNNWGEWMMHIKGLSPQHWRIDNAEYTEGRTIEILNPRDGTPCDIALILNKDGTLSIGLKQNDYPRYPLYCGHVGAKLRAEWPRK